MLSAGHAHHPTALPQKPPVDFHVTRNDGARWTIRAVSERAKVAALREFALDTPAQDEPCLVVGHAKSNAVLHSLRSRGFSILYMGPAGPIRL
ncbi:hypothetical protein [Microvirga terricola]|uniref:Uncharacterized protein n=1 Tax=Microvirga terricola TaxID=2719797 RepID=A0ABX0V9Y6_9HYPH|nr:hypothetical protein [Microvirga terricola]NIX76659.1 hypothetical protein [Microvirga terricola]